MGTPLTAAPSGDATVPAEAGQPEAAGHSVYNPFGTFGVVQVPSTAESAPLPAATGDWSLPVAVTLAGVVAIGWIVRVMLH